MSSRSFKTYSKTSNKEIPVLREFELNINNNQENLNENIAQETTPKVRKAINNDNSDNFKSNQNNMNKNDELKIQNLFVNLTTQLSDLSSKISSILERVDNLEGALPHAKENNTLSLSETSELLINENINTTHNNNNNKQENEFLNQITKLNTLYESLTARLTVLETDVLLIKQVKKLEINLKIIFAFHFFMENKFNNFTSYLLI